jgi:NAD(P)-dependent dehydrogenase (short-subunit alcohol dehydrogenase family)
MAEKIAVVTGATAGLGKALALELARQGVQVAIVARDKSRGEAILAELKAVKPLHHALFIADLARPSVVREVAEILKAQYPRIDLLVNNAAVYKAKREVSENDFESVFATNHLAPFLLSNLLLDNLKAAPSARILTITAPSTSQLNFDDLQGEQKFSALSAFGASKMANLLFTFALARRLAGTNVVAHAIHPGLVKTSLIREAPLPIRLVTGLISKSPEKAALPIVRVALEDEFGKTNGQFYTKAKPIKANAYAYDEQAQERLWQISTKLLDL